MITAAPDVATTRFALPADAKFLPVSDLSDRIRTRIGPVDIGQAVLTRPGFRITTRLVPAPLAALVGEFRAPSLITDAVFRFARTNDQDPQEVLELAFDAIATLVEARFLVPDGSNDALAPAPSLAAGQAFAGFEIAALVRSLEDTEVYRATRDDGVVAALKIARDDRPGATATIAHEALVLERLGGADTPAFLAHGIEGTRAYVAMEWCDGVSIATAAQQARAARDRRSLHRLVGRMIDAYGRLHQHGVLHGDIHPGNCLVRDDGRVVILDFGQARFIGAGSDLDPFRAGIAQFYDPQMAAALLAAKLPPAATPASEQYSIGVLAFVLLTGLQPIDAPAVQDELLQRIVDRPVLPFAARGVASWPNVERVITRAMAKAPGDRFADLNDMARAFRLARRPRAARTQWPGAAGCALADATDAIRRLSPEAATPEYLWLGLRASLALEDAELLAATDLLIAQSQQGWTTGVMAVEMARARSDQRAEARALTGLLASGERLTDDGEAVAAIVAVADLLKRGSSRTTEGAALGGWAVQRLSASGGQRVAEASIVHAALALAAAGFAGAPGDLRDRLDALRATGQGDVWLWALAHEVFADDRYKAAAIESPLPAAPAERGLALLRLHQVTGERRWIDSACRLLTPSPHGRLRASETALLVAELMAPERAMASPRLTVRAKLSPAAKAGR